VFKRYPTGYLKQEASTTTTTSTTSTSSQRMRDTEDDAVAVAHWESHLEQHGRRRLEASMRAASATKEKEKIVYLYYLASEGTWVVSRVFRQQPFILKVAAAHLRSTKHTKHTQSSH
jgi:hypothetical protein